MLDRLTNESFLGFLNALFKMKFYYNSTYYKPLFFYEGFKLKKIPLATH